MYMIALITNIKLMGGVNEGTKFHDRRTVTKLVICAWSSQTL